MKKIPQINSEDVSLAHNKMAEEYDHLSDLWYPWLFATIHQFIAENLPENMHTQPSAVDAGCGTGFQSFLLARAGFDVTGFDIADKLVDVARRKTLGSMATWAQGPLFRAQPHCQWLPDYERRLQRSLDRARGGRKILAPNFIVEDILQFPFRRESVDVITCCGSVLSFVSEYAEVIARMGEALRPGGRMFIEVEQKRNLDLLWPIMDHFSGGALEYDQSWHEIWENLFSKPDQSVKVDYPFELADGKHVILPITLFSLRELERLFNLNRLRIVDHIGIHAITNLIPSTILHSPSQKRILSRGFELLRKIEERVNQVWPVWRLGCSAAYCLERRA